MLKIPFKVEMFRLQFLTKHFMSDEMVLFDTEQYSFLKRCRVGLLNENTATQSNEKIKTFEQNLLILWKRFDIKWRQNEKYFYIYSTVKQI